jgi:hypothetical protein
MPTTLVKTPTTTWSLTTKKRLANSLLHHLVAYGPIQLDISPTCYRAEADTKESDAEALKENFYKCRTLALYLLGLDLVDVHVRSAQCVLVRHKPEKPTTI